MRAAAVESRRTRQTPPRLQQAQANPPRLAHRATRQTRRSPKVEVAVNYSSNCQTSDDADDEDANSSYNATRGDSALCSQEELLEAAPSVSRLGSSCNLGGVSQEPISH
eukprot:6199936-Pleurochrysis_carterae.AAC.2